VCDPVRVLSTQTLPLASAPHSRPPQTQPTGAAACAFEVVQHAHPALCCGRPALCLQTHALQDAVNALGNISRLAGLDTQKLLVRARSTQSVTTAAALQLPVVMRCTGRCRDALHWLAHVPEAHATRRLTPGCALHASVLPACFVL
jgi:hypothetical protein